MTSKYKVVGYMQLVTGVIQSLSSLVHILFVIPRMRMMYMDLNEQVNLGPKVFLAPFFTFLLGLLYIFFALVNLDKIYPHLKEKLYTPGLAYLIFGFSLVGLAMAFSTLSAVTPLLKILQSL